jgi:hypothetical protein
MMAWAVRWLLRLWVGCALLMGLAVLAGAISAPDGLVLWIHNRSQATRWTVDVRTGSVHAGERIPLNSLQFPGTETRVHVSSSLGETTFTRYPSDAPPQTIGTYDVIPALDGLFAAPDGTALYVVDATDSRDTRLYRLSLADGVMTFLSEHPFRTDNILPAPDARHVLLRNELLGAADAETLLVDVQTGDAQSLPPLPGAAAWSQNGRWLAYVTAAGLHIADMHAPTLAERITNTQSFSLDVSSNPQALNWSQTHQLAVVANGVQVLTPPDFTARQVYRRGGLLRSWSPDGCCLLLDTRSGAGVFAPHILHMERGDIHLAATARISAFSRAVWSADETYVAFYQSDPIQGHEILVYEATTGKRQWQQYLRPDDFPPFLLDAPYAFQWHTP